MAGKEKPTAAEAIAAANARGRIERKPRIRNPDISRRTTDYFLQRWEWVVHEVPRFANTRALESIGQATGYFRATFFAPSAGRIYTEADVRSFIDQYMDAVYRSMVILKPNQSAFMRFTGWWGREGKVFHDTTGGSRRYFEEQEKKRLKGLTAQEG